MLVGKFAVPLAIAIVAGLVFVAARKRKSSPELTKIGCYTVAGALFVALILGLIDDDALTPIWEGISR